MLSSSMNGSSNKLQQKTKSKIRPPKKLQSANVINPNDSWKLLKTAINDIQNKNASKWSFEQLYRLAYNMVLSKNGEFLYNNVKNEIEKHLNEKDYIDLKNLILSKYSKTIDSNINDTLKSFNQNGQFISKYDAADILRNLKKIWDDHLLSIWLISEVVMYMDRTFTADNKLPLTYDIGLALFQKNILMGPLNGLNSTYNNNNNNTPITIGTKITEIFLNYFNLNRDGELIDKYLIRSTITIFESLIDMNNVNYYNKYFVPELLINSHRYYNLKVDELQKLQSGSKFVNQIIQIIKDEDSRFKEFFPDSTIELLKNVMYKDLVLSNIQEILNLENDGLQKWIDTDNYDILSKIYILNGKIDPDKTILKNSLRSLVLKNGKELKAVSKPESKDEDIDLIDDSKKKKIKKPNSRELATQFAINYIKNFLILKSKYDQIIINSFQDDIEIYREVESTFSIFLNENNRIQEYLSLFIDDNIKKSLKNKTSDEVEKVFNDAILIFKFIKDKDIFEKYYKNHLAKRLLNQKFISINLELLFINKLKLEAGSTFTAKFEGMFRDIKISNDISKNFKSFSDSSSLTSDLSKLNNGKKFDIEFSILTNSFWPMSANKAMEDVHYVPILDITKSSFEKYYYNKYTGRNLIWAPNMCTMDLKMNYSNKTYEVNMPTLAGFIILTCFNDDEMENGDKALTFKEIYQMTKIPIPELVRHLQSISVSPKTRLLKKLPMSRDIGMEDRFSLNLDFKSSHIKIKVLPISLNSSNSKLLTNNKDIDSNDKFDSTSTTSRVETEEEHTITLASIQKSRELEVDAAIVRLLKANKSMKFENLIIEVVRLLDDVSKRFRPQPSLIKKRVEDLIEKEYLRRDQNDRELFWYIA